MFECSFDFSKFAQALTSTASPVTTVDFLHHLYKKARKTSSDVSFFIRRNEEILKKKTLVNNVIILDHIGEVICDTLTADVLIVMDVASLSVKTLNVKYLFVGQTHELSIVKGSIYLGYVQCRDMTLGEIGVTKELRLYAHSAEYHASFSGKGTVWSFVPNMTRCAEMVMDKRHVFWTRRPDASMIEAAKTSFKIQKELYKQFVHLDDRIESEFEGVDAEDAKEVAMAILSCNALLSMTGGSRYAMGVATATRVIKKMETENMIEDYFDDEERVYTDSMMKEGCVPTDHIRQQKTQPVYATTIYGGSTPPQQVGDTGFIAPNSAMQQASQSVCAAPQMAAPVQNPTPFTGVADIISSVIPVQPIQPIQPIQPVVTQPVQPIIQPVQPIQQPATSVSVPAAPVDIFDPDALMLNGERKSPEVEEMLEGTRKEKAAQSMRAAQQKQQNK